MRRDGEPPPPPSCELPGGAAESVLPDAARSTNVKRPATRTGSAVLARFGAPSLLSAAADDGGSAGGGAATPYLLRAGLWPADGKWWNSGFSWWKPL